jgi:hypothetical protein
VTQDQKGENNPSPHGKQQKKNQGEPKRENQSQEKARNSSPKRGHYSAAENRSESGQSSNAFVAEKPSLKGILRFCRQCKEVFAFLRLHPFGVHPFCSVSFSFPHFL